ncbi:MAG: hypothetical protein WC494_02430 [Candidatus Pacearchaeota archaeon]
MRKIMTQTEIERSNKRKQIVLGVVLIFLLVVSTAGFSWLSKDEEKSGVVEERGIKFYNQNGIWRTQIGEAIFSFTYLPSEVENLTIIGNYSLDNYVNQPLYFNKLEDGAVEILGNLNNYILRYQKACTEEPCEEDLPLKDCTNNFIIFTDGENKVYKEENCVHIVGDQIKGADAFLYKVLNIL